MGERIPGSLGLDQSSTITGEGTLARQDISAPGPTGFKGDERTKQDAGVVEPTYSANPQEQFRIDMRDATSSITRLADVPLFPSGQVIENYFGLLNSQTDYAVIRQYNNYVNAFYIHIQVQTGNPSADVSYAGPSGTCTEWSHILSRPLANNKRIIDCEGYAFIASRLFPAAGWTMSGFRIAYGGHLGQSSNFDYHIAAQLTHGERTIAVSNNAQASRSMHDEARLAFAHLGCMRVLPDIFPTQQAARHAVDQHAQQSGVLGPMDQILNP